MRRLTATFLTVPLLALGYATRPPPAGAADDVNNPGLAAQILHVVDPCKSLDWHAERGLVGRADVDALHATIPCPNPHYAVLAVELAHGRVGCPDLWWARDEALVTPDQLVWLYSIYPTCAPPPPPPPAPPPAPASRVAEAYAAAAAGDYEAVVRLAAEEYGIPAGEFLDVAICESGLDPTAQNPSGASGLLQHMIDYWPGRAEAAGFPGASVFEPVANAFAAAKMWSEQGRGPWSC